MKQGFDQSSQIQQGRTQGGRVFARPSKLEPRRAHLFTYHWDRRDAVEVDLSNALKNGDRFRIVNAQIFLARQYVLLARFSGIVCRQSWQPYHAYSIRCLSPEKFLEFFDFNSAADA